MVFLILLIAMLKPIISMKNYQEGEESSYIMYLDANNLYGWAMSQKLPCRNFRWIDCPEHIKLENYYENSAKGLILEVDLEYPRELHHQHNDYPLAPEKINFEMLSPSLLPRNTRERKDLYWKCQKVNQYFK